jgi:hypothetical protein
VQVEQDALWTMMGKDEPHVLQAVGSNPLTHSHPRFVNGSDGEQEEEEAGSGQEEQAPEVPEKEEGPKQAARAGGRGLQAGDGNAELKEQLAAVQAQLLEQGQLLRAMAAQLGTAAAAPTASDASGAGATPFAGEAASGSADI